MPLFTDPLKEIDAAASKNMPSSEGAEELSDDIVKRSLPTRHGTGQTEGFLPAVLL